MAASDPVITVPTSAQARTVASDQHCVITRTAARLARLQMITCSLILARGLPSRDQGKGHARIGAEIIADHRKPAWLLVIARVDHPHEH